jgi:heat shock protein HtpX
MFRRIMLFMVTNVLILVTISIVTSLLGVNKYLTGTGLNLPMLLAFCAIWGMGGAFISLLLSKSMAKWFMGVKVIDPDAPGDYRDLVARVHRLAEKAGLDKMPEVAYYESPEVNAFATGPSRRNSLVAVSTGLLAAMDRSEVDGVLAHEVAHIANGDMVTMTLIQGVVNAFVMFFARIIAFAIGQFLRGRDDEGPGLSGIAQMLVTIVLEIFFSILGSIVVAWFSRWREYRADTGGAKFAGRSSMIAALEKLRKTVDRANEPETAKAMMSLKISGRPSGFMALFSTHPPLEQRIEALKNSREI